MVYNSMNKHMTQKIH